MFNFDTLYSDLKDTELEPWLEHLPAQIDAVFAEKTHGFVGDWIKLLAEMPKAQASDVDLTADRVRIGQAHDMSPGQVEQLEQQLRTIIPWRKGPYELFGIHVNTEWRSDFKWQRIQPHLSPLKGRTVLDVGCGNGYHMWRMLGEGADLVIGADPSQFFVAQFRAIKQYAGEKLPIHLLPMKSEQLPAFTREYKGVGFDTVFSMGVLYHRASPVEHFKELRSFLRRGGELVLETLVIEGDVQTTLIPKDRYAKMRNVWFVASTAFLIRLLERVGFVNCRVVDECVTSLEEQRATDWMNFESLEDFLDPDDHSKTIEGYPAPRRATIICQAP
ncbi:tRNA 5-methoxyuridine(34)/uridine 5-oxyacetic acid(34) synthase CmoB [Leucothrix arctica]|uniref:tRNA U34 carboxymethyltransferase n=1 Tax=Leucothrix arctica TaxID=1481894 RepID=A0A317CHI0_9GAMM|nr:tRNA 5-methoxyuridine(34)/uridine 5-oxyacetic acid(34) synthase CmoB [Leucothrix arctica]PWQ98008.1 tRNA 5-methoxyuridine(34)/uridine 5-oxyacetic acid(34) synthase CmoB [Leucothrix arctica]